MRDVSWRILSRLGMEPPFRILVRQFLKFRKPSAKTRALWEISKRPAYLLGVIAAAEQASKQGLREISVIEFGVAGGEGLIALQSEAKAVEDEMGIGIRVFGFDMGTEGLPEFIGDFRDHPDAWQQGDFPMDESTLRPRLTDRTQLVLGNVRDTVPRFFKEFCPPPIGFISIDLDLYSSTKEALEILRLPDRRMLWHVPLYFDDIEFLFNHRFAGEMLAVEEFNLENSDVKIDRWYGVKAGRPFPESPFLEKLFVAHDLEATSKVVLERGVVMLPLSS